MTGILAVKPPRERHIPPEPEPDLASVILLLDVVTVPFYDLGAVRPITPPDSWGGSTCRVPHGRFVSASFW
ncbi:hypothetical protein GCM10023107_92710 [Actinoplanes octamycinicus]|nr:hypothetical protein Aoc01nite_40050 [Actinoplanes octamycinicus]